MYPHLLTKAGNVTHREELSILRIGPPDRPTEEPFDMVACVRDGHCRAPDGELLDNRDKLATVGGGVVVADLMPVYSLFILRIPKTYTDIYDTL